MSYFHHISGLLLFLLLGWFAFQNITFSVLQKQCSNTDLWEKRNNSLSGMHTSQSSFSESFSPIFIWRYFLFPHRPECAPKWPFANSSMTQFQNCVIERKFYLCEMHRHISCKAVSQKASFQFLSEDISFFTIVLKVLPNVPSRIRPWWSFQTA